MKNKQILIELHEGCVDPKDSILGVVDLPQDMMIITIQNWLVRKLEEDPASILIDKVQIVECDCEAD